MPIMQCPRRVIATAFVFSLYALPGSAATAPDVNSQSAGIDKVRQDFNRTYSAGNATDLAGLVAEKAVWMPPEKGQGKETVGNGLRTTAFGPMY